MLSFFLLIETEEDKRKLERKNNDYRQTMYYAAYRILKNGHMAIEKITMESQDVYLVEYKSILQDYWTDSSYSYIIIGAVSDKTEINTIVLDLAAYSK